MKLLHLLKSEPDEKTRFLMNALSRGKETSTCALYEEEIDYGKVIDLIFSHDEVISWW